MTTDLLIRKAGPKILFKQGRVELSHGSGGKAMQQLIDQLFLKAFDNDFLRQRNDQACLPNHEGRLVMATDSHVISPLFFPGGDIGSLAVHGTINDIAVGGATPLYLSAAFILEEGFPLSDLKKIVLSMADAAKAANVQIVTGDTKVVEKGKGDGVFISTTGVGVIPDHVQITNRPRPGDQVIINGFIGDHGTAVMSKRQNLQFHTELQSDSAALHELIHHMLLAVPKMHCLRDPTRGGVAASLNEWASQHQVGFMIEESQLPLREAVLGACELLGLDPLYVANEGKVLAICAPEDAPALLATMREHPLGAAAQIIGEVIDDPACFVQMRTSFGGMRIVDWLAGDQLPRIC
jgi:hydrogenase expression/formation protein HypE